MEVVIGEILEEVDLNENGSVELEEFEHLWVLLEKREGFCKREYDRLLEAFCRFDIDESGTIDSEEVLDLLSYLNYSIKSKEVERIWADVDQSGRGELNEPEFTLFMRKVRECEIDLMTKAIPKQRLITKKTAFIRL